MNKKLLLICFCIFLFQIQNSNAQWELVGEDFAGGQTNQQLKLDSNNNLYLAYTDINNEEQIIVKRRSATTGDWELLGSTTFSGNNASDLSLAIYNDMPYIGYKDGDSGKINVSKFDGISWVNVGAAGFSPGTVGDLSLAIDNLGVPYVAFSDNNNNNKTTVMKYASLAWETVGVAGFTTTGTSMQSLAIDSNNVPYVAYQMSGADYSNKGYVSTFNGTSWDLIKSGPNDAATFGLATYINLVIDSNDTLFLGFKDQTASNGTSVMSFDGTSWSYLGSAGFGSNSDNQNLIITNNDVLYVVYRDRSNSSETKLRYYNPAISNWGVINPTIPNQLNSFSFYQKIAVANNGDIFIAFQDEEFNKNKTTVIKHTTVPYSYWENISADNSTEFSFASASYLKTALDANNTPYVAYINENNQLTVTKFNGVKWVVVGTENIDVALDFSFVIDKNNVPYIAYSYIDFSGPPPSKTTKGKEEIATSGNYKVVEEGPGSDGPPPFEVRLLKFDGTSWVSVGDNVKIADGFLPIMALDNNNALHVLFSDSTLEFKNSVIKFNGASWETVGPTGFSVSNSFGSNLVFDSANTPYIGTIENFQNYSVRKFNGVGWQQLGASYEHTDFSPDGNSELINLKIGTNDVLYMSNAAGSGEFLPKGTNALVPGKNALKVFNTTTLAWDDITTAGLPVTFSMLNFDLDPNNVPYIAYLNPDNEIAVNRLNTINQTWELVGTSGFNFGAVDQINMNLDSNSIPYVAYTDENRAYQPRVFSFLTNVELMIPPGISVAWNDPLVWGGTVPTKTSRVTIPAGRTVVIDDVTSAVAASINIEGVLEFNSSGTSSSTLITQTDPIGNIVFKRDVLADQKWHIVAAPLAQNKDVFATNNALASGNGNNKGIGFYNNGNTGWFYYQDGATTSGDFSFGDAYSVLLSDTSELQLAGSATASAVNKVLTKNTTGWNLVGNPYLAFLPINISGNATNNLLDNNAGVFETGFKSLYLWNNDTNDYTVVNQASTSTTFVSPGQGFFINAKDNGAIFKVNPTMRSHETAQFYKSTSNPFSITLAASVGKTVKKSEIKYFNNTTTDLDEGYDAGQFTGGLSSENSVRLFTKLVTDTSNLNIDLALQVLPNANFEEMIVPVGLEVAKETEITLNANVSSLPEGYKVFLEDRKNNVFYQLDTTSEGYKTTVLKSDTVGRFYVHTTTKNLGTTLSVENNNLLNATMYVVEGNILKVNGLESTGTKLEMFNLLGKRVLTENLQEKAASINVNRFAKGFYVIKLKSKEQKEITKKIIIK